MVISFDVCRHFETGRDFSFGDNPQGYSKRSYLTNTQCHAQEDGCQCTRNGRCVIARNDDDWSQITRKSWPKRKGPQIERK